MAGPDARSLATLLATFDDASLTALLTIRRVPTNAGWSDFFDAADALLEPLSVTRGVAALARPEAEALDVAVSTGGAVAPGALRDHLITVGLVDSAGHPYRAVTAMWESIVRTDVPPTPISAHSEGGSPAPHDDAAHSAERAFAASSSLADVLHATLAAPLSRIGTGALGATDRRRLIEIGAVDDPSAADELIAIAAASGLLAAGERQWLVTHAGTHWLGARTVTRWHDVALRLRDALPSSLRTPEGGWLAVAEWPGAHPFDPSWPPRAEHLRRQLLRWAMIDDTGAAPDWAAGLAHGDDADETALQALLPAEVDRVFLQNDLTAIAPGPLDPRLDMRLRSMTHRESRAQASTYRFTADTLSAALTAGETADTIREFLSSLSLTGLPQPLAYEIERSALRHGTVRVGPDWSGRTRVTATDPAVLQALSVDQALRPLGLVEDDEALLSRSSADTVFWMLADARYPVIAVGADGAQRVLDRHRLASEPAAESTAGDYTPLRQRLKDAHESDADAAWLGRELEQAVRAHAVLEITVRLPDGDERTVTIEATGLGGGRLRGRDRVADVERTLPVSSIVRARPV